MGADVIRIEAQIRRFLVISIGICYRSICKHPFLVGMGCMLMLLYRSFPFVFSLLVSTSPVLVCTAVLLGTLLSFGQSNIPEIEKEEEEEVTHEISSLKSRAVEDATVVIGEEESFCIDRFARERKDISERAVEELSFEENQVHEIEQGDCLGDYMPLIDENSGDIRPEKQVIEEVEREFDDLEERRKIQENFSGIEEVLSHEEVDGNQYSLVQIEGDENLEGEDDESPGEFIAAQNGYTFDFSQDSSWKHVNDVDEEDEEASDSGSDGAESSSPDASMADILPMLDELHPLLDEEALLPARTSHDGSDASSERSHKSKDGNIESDDNMEKHLDEEDGDDNDNEEEDAPGDKEDESKSAIKWTEDDQKNLMDLGTLEIERNQRLESLIARRRTRQNLRLMAEKNLIDLDGDDIPLNVRPISTARRNPFDLSYDSYEDIPGSAPSILQPRRNPFDLPYDSSEEKPDLKGDSFEQEFSTFQHREQLIFRRHESFSVGPSVLGGPRQDMQDLWWKPYFVPERFPTEGTSYQTFQRQLSEVSESKVSSVPDTESVSSAVEEEEEAKLNEDISNETEPISYVDHASLLMKQGGMSSEYIDTVDNETLEERDVQHDEDEITLGDIENHHEMDSSLSASGATSPVELNTSEILLRMGAGDEDYSSISSLSSLTEIDEKISDVHGESTSLETSNVIEESRDSIQNLFDSDFQFISGMEDADQHREPDLKPASGHVSVSVISMETSAFHSTSRVEDDNQHGRSVLGKPPSNDIGDARISKQSSLESDSQFMNEMANDKPHNDPVLETIGNSMEGSGISTKTTLESDFHFTSGVVDEIQHKEPVYDSSPSSINKFLSFSSVSSDTQGEASEMGSPSAFTEFAQKESKVQTDRDEKDISDDKAMHETSSYACSLDENESKPRETTEISDCAVTVTAAEHLTVDLPLSSLNNGSAMEDVALNEENSHHELDRMRPSIIDGDVTVETQHDVLYKIDCACSGYKMDSEVDEQDSPVVTEHDSVDSKLSYSKAKAVEEHAAGMEQTHHLDLDQVRSSSFDAHIHGNNGQVGREKLDLAASCSEHMSYVNLNVPALKEREAAVGEEQVPETHLHISSLDTKDVEEHSLRMEETLPFELDRVLSPKADERTIIDLYQDVDVNAVSLGSTYEHVASEESSLFELEKQQSWSDQNTVEPSLDEHDEPLESFETQEGSTKEVSIADKESVLEAYNPEDNMLRNITSLTFDSISVPPASLESESSTVEVGLKDKILDKIVYDDRGHGREYFNYSAEAHGSPVAESSVNDGDDEIKMIDEGLLSELDTVGDFSVKEVVRESFHSEQVPERSTGNPEFDALRTDSIQTDIDPEHPVLEVGLVEDIDMALKQIHEGAYVESVVLLPSMGEDQLVVDESKGPSQSNSDTVVFKARSLEDIDTSMEQVSRGDIMDLSEQSHSKDGQEEQVGTGATKELPILEVQTIRDINLAFEQLHKGVDIEEVILPSTIEQREITDGSQSRSATSSGLPVVEVKSLEDIHVAMKQVLGSDIGEQPKLLESKDSLGCKSEVCYENEVGSEQEIELRTSEVNRVGSSNNIESSALDVIETSSKEESGSVTALSSVQEASAIVSCESNDGLDDTSENTSLSISDVKGKKAKSHGSSSSSSSSSSDSD